MTSTGQRTCLIYASVDHLFVSSGLYYAAELAPRYQVHVLLHERGGSALQPYERRALERRGVKFHWLEEARYFRKHKYFRARVDTLICKLDPAFILTLDDIGLFACYLGRAAKNAAIPFVCFQSGAFLAPSYEEHRSLEHRYSLMSREAAFVARGWPSPIAKFRSRIDPWLRHMFDYWVGPLISGHAPFRGKSSLYLRKGFECQRDGLFFIVNQRGARQYLIDAGCPPETLIAARHPLCSAAGREIYAEMYGDREEDDPILVLLSYSLEPGNDHRAAAARNVARLMKHLAAEYPDKSILLKPHPAIAMGQDTGTDHFLTDLVDEIDRHEEIPAEINAISLIQRCSIIISPPSTAIELARLFDDKIIVCVSFDTPLRGACLPDRQNIHFFQSVASLIACNLEDLSRTVEDSGDGPEITNDVVDHILETYMATHTVTENDG